MSSAWSPWTISLNTNGPVPLGSCETLSSRSAGRIDASRDDNGASSSAYGNFSVILTVLASGASIVSIIVSDERSTEPVAGSSTRLMVMTTSLASSAFPWWNFTPDCSLNVQVFRSWEVSQDDASCGLSDRSLSKSTSVSYTPSVIMYSSPEICLAGSS